MKKLSKPEEWLLLAIGNLREKAYGVEIMKYVSQKTGYDWSIGSVYVPLDRLARVGYVETYEGKPSARRGGRKKRYYKITDEGISALRENIRVQNEMLRGWPDFLLENLT
jgi:PadR family transcriptional regulator PadR